MSRDWKVFVGRVGQRVLLCSALVVAAWSVGCQASGVGDPCIPEAIPADGFTRTESYVETSSAQCRTRVCLVYRLAGRGNIRPGEPAGGNPTRIVDTASCTGDDPTCVTQEQADTRVYCTCRCSAGGGDSTLPLCTCPEQFHCVDLLTQGGDAVRGGYCIRSDQCERDSDCAGGRCVSNRCSGASI